MCAFEIPEIVCMAASISIYISVVIFPISKRKHKNCVCLKRMSVKSGHYKTTKCKTVALGKIVIQQFHEPINCHLKYTVYFMNELTF